MQRLRNMVFSLAVVVTLVGSLALLGCSSDEDNNTTPASANNVAGQSFTFADGAAIDSRLAGKTTVVAFNANATRVSISSGGNRATGTNTFGSCIWQVGNTTNPDAVGGGSNFAATAGPQPGQTITESTCQVNTDNNTLELTNSNGTAGTSNVAVPTGTGGFGS